MDRSQVLLGLIAGAVVMACGCASPPPPVSSEAPHVYTPPKPEEVTGKVAANAFTVALNLAQQNCPARMDAAMQSVIDAMNAAPERAGFEKVTFAQGTDVRTFAGIWAKMADEAQMPPRRLMWLSIDALGQGIDDASYFDFMSALTASSAPSASLGISFKVAGDRIVIDAVVPGGPAERAGLKAGDAVVSIDSEPMTLVHRDEVILALRGEQGSTVTVVVSRDGRELSLSAVRETKVYAGPTMQMRGRIAVITLDSFTYTTTDEMKDLIARVRKAEPKVEGYVLDLRRNTGGGLEAILEVSDLFLEVGASLSTVLARHCGSTTYFDGRRYNTRAGDITNGAPVVLLIGQGTATGAEAFTGVLMERARARSVGQRTMGLGRVQTVFPLGPHTDGAFRLTTSEMTLPSGRYLQGEGVAPTVEIGVDDDAIAKALELLVN